MTDKPRTLTEAQIEAMRDAMKGALRPVPAAGDHTPNAITAETLRKSDAGVDVYQVSGEEDLYVQLGLDKQ